MKHVHAEEIHAFAEGLVIQIMYGNEWVDDLEPIFFWHRKYRVKPIPLESAAPKCPQTTMTPDSLRKEFNADMGGPVDLALIRVADIAIAHECSTGELVPADKVREIEAKARAEGKREGLHPVAVIQAVVDHMRLGSIDADTIQIILLKAAQL